MTTIGDVIEFFKRLYDLILDFFNKFIKKDGEADPYPDESATAEA